MKTKNREWKIEKLTTSSKGKEEDKSEWWKKNK